MPRNLKILNESDWFLAEGEREDGSPGYPIYYRHAICYSIAINIIKYNRDKAWVKQEIDKLIKSLKNKERYKCENFLELHPLVENRFAAPTGFVLVDQTNSYYPLVFYDNDPERDGKERVSSLEFSLDAISQALDKIWDTLFLLNYEGGLTSWTSEFQEELLEIYAHKPNK
ncbi:MAG: hypothetical protein ACYTXE_31315 [Nostoc sp.]